MKIEPNCMTLFIQIQNEPVFYPPFSKDWMLLFCMWMKDCVHLSYSFFEMWLEYLSVCSCLPLQAATEDGWLTFLVSPLVVGITQGINPMHAVKVEHFHYSDSRQIEHVPFILTPIIPSVCIFKLHTSFWLTARPFIPDTYNHIFRWKVTPPHWFNHCHCC